MRPAETFTGQPIRDLQTMLRVLQLDAGESNPLIPDGIYGETTRQAVAEFQRSHSLPVTGIADLGTWEKIFSAYTPVRINMIPACPVQIQLQPNQVLRREDHHPNLFLIQGMLLALAEKLPAISPPSVTGTLDGPTAASITSFQGLCRLPRTGELDKITWKYLAHQFPLICSLEP